MSKPIKPDDVAFEKARTIPAVVFEAVNELIVEKWRGNGVTLLQRDILQRIESKDPTLRPQLFERGYMDFEDAYRAEGWTVEYDRPGYNETYEASFTFSRGKQPSGGR